MTLVSSSIKCNSDLDKFAILSTRMHIHRKGAAPINCIKTKMHAQGLVRHTHRVSGFSVVLHSCSGIISPKPLKRVTETPCGKALRPTAAVAAVLLSLLLPAAVESAALWLSVLLVGLSAVLDGFLRPFPCCWPAAAEFLVCTTSARIPCSPASSYAQRGGALRPVSTRNRGGTATYT